VFSADRGDAPEQVAQAQGELGVLAHDVLASRDPGTPERPVGNEAPAAVVASPVAPPAEAPTRPTPSPLAAEAAQAATAPRLNVTSAVAAESRSPEGALAPLTAFAADRVAPMAASNASADGSSPGRVVIVARASSWVQVRSPDRDYVRSRTMRPGERFVLPARIDLALWTGNAGGIELVVDGRSLGRPGETGSVLKNLPLTPDGLKSGVAAPAR
jgi:cytoskeleton protein RodZ